MKMVTDHLGRVHTEESLREALKTDRRMMKRALILLFDRQTTDEKQSNDAKYHNSRGFSACHASKGCRYAKWLLGRDHSGQPRQLSDYHFEKCKAFVPKYVRQLMEEIELKAERLAVMA